MKTAMRVGATVLALLAMMIAPDLLAANTFPDLLTAMGPSDLLTLLIAPAVAATTRDLKTILKEMKEVQDAHRGKAMPEDVGEKFQKLAT